MSELAYRKDIFKLIDFKPFEAQKPFFESQAMIKLFAGGEGAGKSYCGAVEALLHVPESDLIWICAIEYEKTRQEFFYLQDYLNTMGLLKRPTKADKPPWSLAAASAMGECRIVTKSIADLLTIGMEAPRFILVSEAAQITFDAYLRLVGRLARTGGKMAMTGTFEGSLGWYPDYFTRWQAPNEEGGESFSVPSWTNTALYPGGRDDPKILRLEAEYSPELFSERFGGKPCKPAGLIVREFSNAIHVKDAPEFNPEYDVELAIDPGYGDSIHAVLAIQEVGEKIHIIDEIYRQGYTTESMIAEVKQRKWWHKVTGGAIDFYARQHHAGPAAIELWKDRGENGAGLYLRSKKVVKVEDVIETVRSYFKVNPYDNQPKTKVNAKCRGLIAECGGGKNPIPGGGAWLRDVNTGKEINRNNHATKAFGYWIINKYGYIMGERKSNYGKLQRVHSR